MEKIIDNRLVIKIGSSSLVNGGDSLNEGLIRDLARQVSHLHGDGTEVAIVTSGAIASGRMLLGERNGELVKKQTFAAAGHRILLDAWGKAFDEHGVKIGFYLFSETDLDKPRLPLLDALTEGIVPIINANDTVNLEEVRKLLISADNDRLASFVAKYLVNANRLILLTERAGVLDSCGNVIESIASLEDLERVCYFGKSDIGTGGMESKILEARKFIEQGKIAYIVGAKEKDVILRVMRNTEVGTKITLPLQGFFNI